MISVTKCVTKYSTFPLCTTTNLAKTGIFPQSQQIVTSMYIVAGVIFLLASLCLLTPHDICTFIGTDFHTAMVATAPGEKLLTGRRPVRNWSPFLCRKLHLFVGKKEQKLLPPELHFLTPTCTKSSVGPWTPSCI